MINKTKFVLFFLLLILISSCGSKFEYITGNDLKGFNDGSYMEARFNNPTAMDVDNLGNLYVIDQSIKVGNDLGRFNAIRKITPDGKVSTVVKFKDEENAIDSIKINENYLYFANRTCVKRFNLTGDVKIENVVGTDESKDVNGDFEIARFYNIYSITIDNEGNLYILDRLGASKIKKANNKTRKVESLKFEKAGSIQYSNSPRYIEIDSTDSTLISRGNVEKIEINPKNNQLYFKSAETFGKQIFQINEKNQILDTPINDISGVSDSFTFDNEGNMYVISIGNEKLIKVSPDNKIEELLGLGGTVKIEKDSSFPESGYLPRTNLVVDNKRKTLYLSSEFDNKIFKINLKK